MKKTIKRTVKKKWPAYGALWGICNFPVKLRNQFVGMCTERGFRINHTVEAIVARWIREEKSKERQSSK